MSLIVVNIEHINKYKIFECNHLNERCKSDGTCTEDLHASCYYLPDTVIIIAKQTMLKLLKYLGRGAGGGPDE